MKNKIKLIKISNLKNHELVSKRKVIQIKNDLITRGVIKNPVIVDRNYQIILDGHHRVNALKDLGYNFIPAYLVNYQSKDVRVYLRRKKYQCKNIKQKVINYCLEGKIFPSKTTKHFIKNRPRNINISLNSLL